MINGTVGSMIPAPFVLGHEGAGVVEAIGSQVTTVKVGDHVVLTTIDNCGRCAVCVTGHPTLCQNSTVGASHGAGRALESTDELRRTARVLPSRRQTDLGDGQYRRLRRAGRRQRRSGHRHRQERAVHLGLSDRLRVAHRRGCRVQPGARLPRRLGRGDRRRRHRYQLHPSRAHRRCDEDHRGRCVGVERSDGPPVRRHPFRRCEGNRCRLRRSWR